jgi:hypothetical protein
VSTNPPVFGKNRQSPVAPRLKPADHPAISPRLRAVPQRDCSSMAAAIAARPESRDPAPEKCDRASRIFVQQDQKGVQIGRKSVHTTHKCMHAMNLSVHHALS